MIHCRDEKALIRAMKAIWESQSRADGDFCGEQREWHLPRLNNAVMDLARAFPIEMSMALDEADV
jgi:hypothetical protein